MFHDIFFFFGVDMIIEHFVGAVKIRDDEIYDFFISAAPTVDDSGVMIAIIFY